MVGISEAGRAERLLCVRDVGLLAVRVTECAERVRVNWRADGSATWRADVVTVSDDGLILAAKAAGLCGRPGRRLGSCFAGGRGVEGRQAIPVQDQERVTGLG